MRLRPSLLVRGTVLAATTAVAVPAAYLGTLTVAAVGASRRLNGPRQAGQRRFAIMIPAHDEEAVIGATIRSYHALAFPPDRFAVHVVADNCSDATADLVRGAGWVVHERTDPELPGKSHALNWLHDRLVADPATWGTFDVFVVVDADSVVDPQLLAAFDAAFERGAVAAQAFYGVTDVEATPAVSLRYAALACRHHLRPLGRTAIGGSCGLYGNGMAFTADLLATRRWSGHLVEDAELQLELLLDGHLVSYVPEARVMAEMPDTLGAARSQNERWELGRIQLVRRFVPELARRTVRGDRRSRVAAADALADQLVPPLSVMVAGNVAALGLSAITALFFRRRLDRIAAKVAAAALVTTGAHVLVALRLVHAPAAVYRSLRQAPGMMWWKLQLWLGVLRHPDRVRWTRTARNREKGT